MSKYRGKKPKMDGWFIMENPIKMIKMDDLGVSLFLETPSCLQVTGTVCICSIWEICNISIDFKF